MNRFRLLALGVCLAVVVLVSVPASAQGTWSFVLVSPLNLSGVTPFGAASCAALDGNTMQVSYSGIPGNGGGGSGGIGCQFNANHPEVAANLPDTGNYVGMLMTFDMWTHSAQGGTPNAWYINGGQFGSGSTTGARHFPHVDGETMCVHLGGLDPGDPGHVDDPEWASLGCDRLRAEWVPNNYPFTENRVQSSGGYSSSPGVFVTSYWFVKVVYDATPTPSPSPSPSPTPYAGPSNYGLICDPDTGEVVFGGGQVPVGWNEWSLAANGSFEGGQEATLPPWPSPPWSIPLVNPEYWNWNIQAWENYDADGVRVGNRSMHLDIPDDWATSIHQDVNVYAFVDQDVVDAGQVFIEYGYSVKSAPGCSPGDERIIDLTWAGIDGGDLPGSQTNLECGDDWVDVVDVTSLEIPGDHELYGNFSIAVNGLLGVDPDFPLYLDAVFFYSWYLSEGGAVFSPFCHDADSGTPTPIPPTSTASVTPSPIGTYTIGTPNPPPTIVPPVTLEPQPTECITIDVDEEIGTGSFLPSAQLCLDYDLLSFEDGGPIEQAFPWFSTFVLSAFGTWGAVMLIQFLKER